jgi:hypothetical protein
LIRAADPAAAREGVSMAEHPAPQIRLELLNKFMSPEFQTGNRRELANRLKDEFMKDPKLLAEFERLLGAHQRGLAEVRPTAEQLRSFGWTQEETVACPAAVVAAAAATWAAAAAQLARSTE